MFNRSLRNGALFVAAAILPALSLRAQTYNEVLDAGQTPGTAQASGLTQGGVGSTVMILGNISGINDADVFSITLTLPMQVRITTNNTLTLNSNGPGGLDTALFLFSSTGVPIYTNDDTSGTIFQSTLPNGSSFTLTLSPGTYLIGISLSGNEPMNSNGQLVFASSADPAAVRGPAAGLNPSTFSNFNSNAQFAQNGNYQIDISTFAVPEPSTVSLLSGALVLIAFCLRKRLTSVRDNS